MDFSKTVFGYEGLKPSESFLRFVERVQPAGIIIFERNIESISSLKNIISNFKSLSPASIMMIDEEGGAKSRLRKEHGFPNPPDPREAGRTMRPSQVREAYMVAGEALREIGFDLDLAPVVDVAPEGHILGGRSFSDRAEICAEFASAAVEGLILGGVQACAKHFPGLGSAMIDPHLALSVAGDEEDFWGVHFKPFQAAISAGVQYVMTTHLVAKSLDSSGICASYSEKIVRLLHDELGFLGKIISDDLFMGGADFSLSLEERSQNAISAGHNLVLVCREYPGQIQEVTIE